MPYDLFCPFCGEKMFGDKTICLSESIDRFDGICKTCNYGLVIFVSKNFKKMG